MQIANACLQAEGYRTLTSKPGHNQTMIQSLAKTINLDHQTIIVLDALRKQRHIIDYSGDIVTDAMVHACLEEAQQLLRIAKNWFEVQHSDLH